MDGRAEMNTERWGRAEILTIGVLGLPAGSPLVGVDVVLVTLELVHDAPALLVPGRSVVPAIPIVVVVVVVVIAPPTGGGVRVGLRVRITRFGRRRLVELPRLVIDAADCRGGK